MKRRSLQVQAALFLAAPLVVVFFAGTATAQWDDDTAAEAAAESPTPPNDGTPHPKAGAWLVDLRVPVSIILSDPDPSLQSVGLDVGVGHRVTDRWYLGGVVGAGQVLDLTQGSFFGLFRAGVETHYIFHEGAASVSTNGEDGPYYSVPRYDWLGARAGVESLDSWKPSGGFAELDFGTDAWLNSFAQFGLVIAAGLSFEPAGTYGAASVTQYSGPPAPSSKIANPYFTLAFHFGLGG